MLQAAAARIGYFQINLYRKEPRTNNISYSGNRVKNSSRKKRLDYYELATTVVIVNISKYYMKNEE